MDIVIFGFTVFRVRVVTRLAHVDVVILMVGIENALQPCFHLVAFCKFSPRRATKIGLVCLLGD
jgi:hypothetical protein